MRFFSGELPTTISLSDVFIQAATIYRNIKGLTDVKIFIYTVIILLLINNRSFDLNVIQIILKLSEMYLMNRNSIIVRSSMNRIYSLRLELCQCYIDPEVDNYKASRPR